MTKGLEDGKGAMFWQHLALWATVMGVTGYAVYAFAQNEQQVDGLDRRTITVEESIQEIRKEQRRQGESLSRLEERSQNALDANRMILDVLRRVEDKIE